MSRKREPTDFGKKVKLELLLQNRTQKWLEQEVSARTGRFMDSSVMYKVLTGQVHSPVIETSICSILQISRMTRSEENAV